MSSLHFLRPLQFLRAAHTAAKTRNIGIIAHIDAGKTTTTERMLFFSGKTARMGNVDEGDTVTDYLPSERQRGITIQLAAISFPWNGHHINVIDTPGHADFTFEVTRSLRVLDGAVTILDAVAGVEAQTEKVWRQAAALGIPRLAYVNKMDRAGAGFSRTVRELVSRLATRAVCVNVPYFAPKDGEMQFAGVLDVVHCRRLVWTDASGTKIDAQPLSPGSDDYNLVLRCREAMVETLGELDDSVVEAFFDAGEDYMAVPAGALQQAIQRATVACAVTPVLCGSSFRNIGVQPVMDAVAAYLPSPLEARLPEVTTTNRKGLSSSSSSSVSSSSSSSSSSLAVPVAVGPKGLVVNGDRNLTVALAFKVVTHATRGVMAFFRVYSGTLASNSTVINTRTGKKLHLRRLMLMHGDVPEEVAHVAAGNIGVVAGMDDDIATGDTLVLRGATHSKTFSPAEAALRMHAIDVPPPLFNAAVEPLTAGDARHMNECIRTLVREDPSLHVHVDDDMGQTVLSGMGELHLEIVRDRLVKDMKARVRLRDVAVSYKETVARPDGRPVRVAAADYPDVYVDVALDSFEGAAAESLFAQEQGAVLVGHDNNVVVLGDGATPQAMTQAVADRRWKCEQSLEDLQGLLVQGCVTGLQIGGPVFGLPLHSCAVRIVLWNFPAEEKTVPPAILLDVGRRAVAKAVATLAEKTASGSSDVSAFGVLEPIMAVKVYVELDVLGEVVHDLNSRCQATILSIDDESDSFEDQNWARAEAERLFLPPDYTMKTETGELKNKKTIVAEAPLREMVGYLSRLRSITQGRGAFDMSYQGMRRANKARLASIKSEFAFM